MSRLGIATGTIPNDNTGDSLINGAVKINSNFSEVYTYFGDGTNLLSGVWNKTSVGINTLSNVGVGTTNPTSKLSVFGDINVSGVITASSFSGFIGYANTSGISSLSQGITGSPNITVGVVTATQLNVGAGGTIITTTINGSIGINSTLPNKTLDVLGDVKVGINTSQGVILTSPNGTQYRIIIDDAGILSTVAA